MTQNLLFDEAQMRDAGATMVLDNDAYDWREKVNLARKTDPATSHEAAAHIRRKATAVQRAFLAALLDEPQTAIEAACEAAKAHGGLMDSYRKRAHEVVRMGWAEIRSTRECRITRQRASVFEITEAGKQEISK